MLKAKMLSQWNDNKVRVPWKDCKLEAESVINIKNLPVGLRGHPGELYGAGAHHETGQNGA